MYTDENVNFPINNCSFIVRFTAKQNASPFKVTRLCRWQNKLLITISAIYYNRFQSPSGRILFAAATAVASAANAGEDEDEPHDVATAKSAHIAAATAVVEEHQEQNDITAIAAASVCTVRKESVHFMYLLIY